MLANAVNSIRCIRYGRWRHKVFCQNLLQEEGDFGSLAEKTLRRERMASTRNKIEQTLREIYACISDERRDAVVHSALLKMAYKDDNESNVLSAVMDALDETEAEDVSPVSPSCIKLEASSELIGWDDIEQYLQEDHIDDFETRLAAVDRERDDQDESRQHKMNEEGYYREPDELQGHKGVNKLDSEYRANDNREYDASAKTYTYPSSDPTDPQKLEKVTLGLDNRRLPEGDIYDAALDVWPPRTRADVQAR